MTSNFDKHGLSQQRNAAFQSSPSQMAPAAALDNLKRDRFELLSAYLDGEVTVTERRQVEQWLETDHNMRCLYSRLLKLRQGMRTMAVPASEQSVEQTLKAVYKKVDRSPKVVIAWVGAALALLAVPLFSNDLRFGFANSVPEQGIEVQQSSPTVSDQDADASPPEINLRVDTSIVGPAAAGLPASGQQPNVQAKEISKDDVMLQLNKSVVPIPAIGEHSESKATARD
ncbi:MAG: transcriptional regulator [Cyanobacteria bacterium P01_F01_bin.150]